MPAPVVTPNDQIAEILRQMKTGEFPPPKPVKRFPGAARFKKLRDHLVIFIDVLGFGDKVLAADTTAAALHRIYRKLLKAQNRFDMPTAGNEGAELTSLNHSYGKIVLALSDSIVVAVDPESEAARVRNPYDVLCLELLYVLHAQMRLLADGIFLRGGISHGKFFYQDELLISPALVRAHRIETKVACHPRILIGQSTLDWIRTKRGAPLLENDATRNYLRPLDEKFPQGTEPMLMLDYLPEYAREFQERWVDPADHQRYSRARSAAVRTKILETKWRKASQMVFKVHREKAEWAYRRSKPGSPVRAKYEWVLKYHNQAAAEWGPDMKDYYSRLAPLSP